MGYSLYVRRTNGREGHLSPVDLAQALTVFNAIPWRDEVSEWLSFAPEIQEEHRPVFVLLDDAARGLHITAYSDDLVAFAYEYPYQGSDFGLALSDKQAHLGTDQYPRSQISELLSAFLDGNQDAIFEFLRRYPARETAKP
jgi:hypothetical protein